MQTEYAKVAALGVWAVSVLVTAVALDPTSAAHWIGLATLTVVPPVVVQKLWRVPAETMSEQIRQAQR